MKYIKIVPKMRYAGKGKNGDMWINTMSIIRLIVRGGKLLNTGVNVIVAKKIANACDVALKDSEIVVIDGGNKLKLATKYVMIEDGWHILLMKDLNTINFTEIGMVGIAIADDVEAIANASAKMDEKDGDLLLDYVGKEEPPVKEAVPETEKAK